MTPKRTGRLSLGSPIIHHLTTVHPRNDIRIAVKQCATLASDTNNRVELIVADGRGSDPSGPVPVTDLGFIAQSRVTRPFKGFVRALRHLRATRPSVLHFHDPELLPLGMLARLMGITVIYDVHEDVPGQLRGRRSLGFLTRHTLSLGAWATEWLAARMLHRLVCATPSIAARFPARKTTVVQNFPIVGELLTPSGVDYSDRPPAFVYIGGITALRGATEMVQAAAALPAGNTARLHMAGPCHPADLQAHLQRLPGSEHVRFHGSLARQDVAKLLGNARAGLVLFHSAPNHINAQPNKLFEYMSAGLPVIASDFPLWRELIDGIGSGLLVDPTDVDAISRAMQWIVAHPDEAKEMGRRGREAVESRLNWQNEARILLDLYRDILPTSPESLAH